MIAHLHIQFLDWTLNHNRISNKKINHSNKIRLNRIHVLRVTLKAALEERISIVTIKTNNNNKEKLATNIITWTTTCYPYPVNSHKRELDGVFFFFEENKKRYCMQCTNSMSFVVLMLAHLLADILWIFTTLWPTLITLDRWCCGMFMYV